MQNHYRFLLFSDFFPIRPERLLVFIVTADIILFILQRVGQILLRDIVMRIVVRIEIMLSLVWVVLAVVMLILQLTRNRAGIAAADVLHGGVDRHIGGVGLRRVADQDHRVRQRDPRFRQADRLGDIDAGFHDRNELRIGEPDVLAGADHESSAG